MADTSSHISEPAHPTSPEHPRKRLRTSDTKASSSAAKDHLPTFSFAGGDYDSMPQFTRDNKFYFADADCVIGVENTLFRVHRFLLVRDSSAFSDMFSMPGPRPSSAVAEGHDDEQPILLYGDTADSFRTLLEVLYALPSELHTFHTAQADFDRLLTIAEMTNKYHFSATEAWAADALYQVVLGSYGTFNFECSSSARLARTLEVALLCEHRALEDYVVKRWTALILARELPASEALEVADRSGLRALQGAAYYMQLVTCGLEGSDRGRRIRLLCGHMSLVQLWDRLQKRAPAFERPEGCTYHLHGCLSTWRTVWMEVGSSEATRKCQTADVLGRLRLMQDQLFMHSDLISSLTPQCMRRALIAVKELMQVTEEKLADHFVDLTVDDGAVKTAA